MAQPAHRGSPRQYALRGDLNRIGDQKTGQQTNTELAQKLGATFVKDLIALRGAANGRQELLSLLGRQTHTGVGNGDAGAVLPGLQEHPGGGVGLLLPAGSNSVNPVLNRLAQVNLRARIQVLRQQLNQAAQINFKAL